MDALGDLGFLIWKAGAMSGPLLYRGGEDQVR
jgi:hypothetical protein